VSDKLYWFKRNLAATILNILVCPIYYTLMIVEDLYFAFNATVKADGSTEVSFPWEHEWPLFRERK
jgi:hypothetical protein